jgi:hypothetical protein
MMHEELPMGKSEHIRCGLTRPDSIRADHSVSYLVVVIYYTDNLI